MKIAQKKASSQKGSSTVFVIISIIVVILVIGYLGIQPGGFLSKSIIQNAPSRTTTVPVDQWLTFESTDPKFSVKYPKDWVYQKRESSDPNTLLTLAFTADDSTLAKGSAVVVSVKKLGSALTLQDWITKYTTSSSSDDPKVQGKTYSIYNVKGVTSKKIGSRDVITYSVDSSVGGKIEGVLTMSDKYVFLFASQEGKATDVKSSMIESFSF